MHVPFARPKQLNSSPKLLIKPDCPCLADEIAEPRPDMNIKVTAFTVSEKSINIYGQKSMFYSKLMRCC